MEVVCQVAGILVGWRDARIMEGEGGVSIF